MKKFLGNKGVTLLELMVVVAIIGVIAAIGIPNYLKMVPHMRLKSAVMNVSDVLQLARMKAVTKNKTYMVKFDYSANSFEMGEWVPPTGTNIIKEQDSSNLDWKGIDLRETGSSSLIDKLNEGGVPGTVKFKSDGTASVDTTSDLTGQRAVFLRNNPINNNEEYRVVVSEISGKINVQHLVGTSWID